MSSVDPLSTFAFPPRIPFTENPAMNRPTALALIAALWAGIYLPGLGSTEIKGEEGRRILPAVTMLETGNWLVPYVGGKPFLRKREGKIWSAVIHHRFGFDGGAGGGSTLRVERKRR